jgi:hypothetical protein
MANSNWPVMKSIQRSFNAATTDAMNLSSHGGLLLLQREEEHLSLTCQLASCIEYRRTAYLVRHSLTEVIMTRIFQICMGYEDVNNCDRMRQDPDDPAAAQVRPQD